MQKMRMFRRSGNNKQGQLDSKGGKNYTSWTLLRTPSSTDAKTAHPQYLYDLLDLRKELHTHLKSYLDFLSKKVLEEKLTRVDLSHLCLGIIAPGPLLLNFLAALPRQVEQISLTHNGLSRWNAGHWEDVMSAIPSSVTFLTVANNGFVNRYSLQIQRLNEWGGGGTKIWNIEETLLWESEQILQQKLIQESALLEMYWKLNGPGKYPIQDLHCQEAALELIEDHRTQKDENLCSLLDALKVLLEMPDRGLALKCLQQLKVDHAIRLDALKDTVTPLLRLQELRVKLATSPARLPVSAGSPMLLAPPGPGPSTGKPASSAAPRSSSTTTAPAQKEESCLQM